MEVEDINWAECCFSLPGQAGHLCGSLGAQGLAPGASHRHHPGQLAASSLGQPMEDCARTGGRKAPPGKVISPRQARGLGHTPLKGATTRHAIGAKNAQTPQNYYWGNCSTQVTSRTATCGQ